MALGEAVAGAIADVVAAIVNGVLRGMGYSEIEVKRIESIMMWTFIGLFVAVLVGITLVYS
jgi:hypothetical protein